MFPSRPSEEEGGNRQTKSLGLGSCDWHASVQIEPGGCEGGLHEKCI